MRKRKQKNAKTLIISIPEERWEIKTQLAQLANELDCSIANLICYGIKQMLNNPPKKAPASSAFAHRGFWIKLYKSTFVPFVPQVIEGVEIIEVFDQNTIKAGRCFFEYKNGQYIKENRTAAFEEAHIEACALITKLGFQNKPRLNLLA